MLFRIGAGSPLVLDGTDLKLVSVKVNGNELKVCNFETLKFES